MTNEIWNPEMCKTNRDLDRALMSNEIKDLQRLILERVGNDKENVTVIIHQIEHKLNEVENKIDTHLSYSKTRMEKEDEAKKFYKRTALILLISIIVQILAKVFPAASKVLDKLLGTTF